MLVERHPVIERFTATYPRRREFFRKIAELCHDQCQKALVDGAIRHFASYRAKSSERLKTKLYQRLKRRLADGKDYPDEAAIENDIVDFAGVRIALYFPDDAPAAVRILNETFDVRGKKDFHPKTDRDGPDGYEYRFGGYSATHLRVRLKRETVAQYEDADEFASALIEIQIASVFMHAWAEVEHELVYKPHEGVLSVDEYSLLDQANGLAYAAEMALEQLQRARTRTRNRQDAIPNHYDLAAYIHAHTAHLTDNTVMGRADRLHEFLSRLNLNRPDRLDELIRKIPDTHSSVPLVDRLVEVVINSDPAAGESRQRLWKEIVEASLSKEQPDEPPPHDETRQLIDHWTAFNEMGRRVYRDLTGRKAPSLPDRQMIEGTLGFDRSMTVGLLAARDAYARLIAGAWKGSDSELREHAEMLESGLHFLSARFGRGIADQEDDR